MGLLQDIRQVSNGMIAVAEKKEVYAPVFLGIVHRKKRFYLDKQSLQNEIDTCLRKEKKDFFIWLKENGLSIKETDLHFKIYK